MVLVQHMDTLAFSRGGKVFVQREKNDKIIQLERSVSNVKEGTTLVVALSLNADASLLVALLNDKTISIWNIKEKEITVSTVRSIPRNALAMTLASVNDREYIVIGDKTGEVLALDLVDTGRTPEELLQHTSSIIMDVAISHDMKYLLTADRDEKIRVSHFPRTMLTHGYCLGHTSFVSKLCLPKTYPDVLLTLGGDAVVNLWNFTTCTLLQHVKLPIELLECTPTLLAFCCETDQIIAAVEECPSLFFFKISMESGFFQVASPHVEHLPTTPTSILMSKGKTIVELISVPYFMVLDNISKSIVSCPDMSSFASHASTIDLSVKGEENNSTFLSGQLRKKRIVQDEDWKEKKFPAIRFAN